MSSLFVILLPSIVGIKTYDTLIKNENIKNTITNYLLLVLISNTFLMLLIAIKNKFEYNLIEYINSNMIFSLKYIALSLIVNFILAFIFSIVSKNITFELERVASNEKSKKK